MQMLFAVIILPTTMLGVYYPWSALHQIADRPRNFRPRGNCCYS